MRISDGASFSTEDIKVICACEVAQAGADFFSGVKENGLFAIKVKFEKVSLGDGNYNEELLASLRDFLKVAEEKGVFGFIIPTSDKKVEDSDSADELISAMVHVARRIKDCTSVIGFSIPVALLEKDKGGDLGENSWSRWFVNDMNVKHSHYVYFVERSVIQQIGMDAEVSKTEYVMY